MSPEVMTEPYEVALGKVVPQGVRKLSFELGRKGKELWLVGGSVRDHLRALLRGTKAPSGGDWDLATDATPEEVIATFKKVIPTGLKHGTVTVLLDGQSYEVTTLRGERGHSDGRRPDEVFFIEDITLDLARRDFTVNAIALDLRTNQLVDPFGGIDDLKAGVLRAVGTPVERFREDGLRVLRAARFAATLEMTIEEETLASIPLTHESFRMVSAERVREEFIKALKARLPSRFLRTIRSTGLLSIVFDELFQQESSEPRFEHACALVDGTGRDPLLRLALLFSLGLANGAQRSKVALGMLERAKMSHLERERVLLFLQAEELPSDLEPQNLRVYLSRFGREAAEAALLFVAARFAEGTTLGSTNHLLTLLRRELQSGCPLAPGELAVGGNDLLRAGLPKGPLLGKVLRLLFAATLKDPQMNEKQRLLALAEKLAASPDLG